MRIPIHIYLDTDDLQTFDRHVKEGKSGNKAEAHRYFVKRGIQFDALLEIYHDPEKRTEFESKLKYIVTEKDAEQVLDTMDIKMLDTIIFIANNKKDKRVQQMMLDIKKVESH